MSYIKSKLKVLFSAWLKTAPYLAFGLFALVVLDAFDVSVHPVIWMLCGMALATTMILENRRVDKAAYDRAYKKGVSDATNANKKEEE